MRRPRRPEPVDQRPGADLAGNGVDEHRTGVLPAWLVGPTPRARYRRSSPRTPPRRPARVAARASMTSSPAPRSLAAESQTEVRRGTHADSATGCTGAQVANGHLDQAGSDVGTVATGVHPHRAADRSRNADRPLEAGQAAPRALPRQHGQRHAPIRPARRPRSTSISNRSVNAVADTTIPRKPASATNTLEPRPRIRTGKARRLDRRGDAPQIVEFADAGEDSSRGRPLGRSSTDRSARRVRRCRRAPRARRRSLRRSEHASRGQPGASGIEHLGREMLQCRRIPSRCTRRPGAPRPPGTNEVVAARQPHDALLGMGLERRRSTTSLPVTPGIGVVPDG